MKKLYTTLLAFLICVITFSQAPNSFKYQAVVRDVAGNILPTQNVSFRINILQGTSSGISVYEETHNVATNQYGLVNMAIGAGSNQFGDFSTIDWANGPYFVKLELDATGGINYQEMGTSQLLSVPYALHAGSVDNIDDADADPTNEIQDISLIGTDLSITNGSTVDLSQLQDGTIDADADSTNELQVLSISNDTLFLSNGGFAKLPETTEIDADTTNELQVLSYENDTLRISKGNYVVFPNSNINNNGGKTYLVLSGDITDAEAVTKIANEVGPNTQFVQISNTTNLTTIDLSSITELQQILIFSNEALSSLDISNLEHVTQSLSVYDNDLITTLDLSSLISSQSILISNNSLSTLSIPILEKVYGNLHIQNCDATSISFPELTRVNILNISNCLASSLLFSKLEEIRNLPGSHAIIISNNSNLTNLSIPLLSFVESSSMIEISNNSSLDNISIPSLTTELNELILNNNSLTTLDLNFIAGYYDVTYNKLSSNSINSILSYLVSFVPVLTSAEINLNNQNPAAPPTGQGLVDKATLESNGNTVTTD